MSRPGPAPSLMVLGGGTAAVGALLTWATVEIDLSAVFALFSSDYRQRVSGPELDGGLALALGLLMLFGGAVVIIRPRWAEHAAWVGVAGALVAVMDAILHLARIRAVTLNALAIASERPSVLSHASVGVGIGTPVVLVGAVAVMVGAVLVLTGRGRAPATGRWRSGTRARPHL